jgi:DNA-binding NtrC family response regulator
MANQVIQTDFLKEKARILIVDDEQDTLNIFRRELEDEYEIDTADSAVLAIEKLKRNVYHIAMTDLVMPGEDGLELMKTIKEKWPQIAVVVISGKATIGMAVEAMKLGAEEFIEKPVEDLDLLKLIIERILKAKWLTEENERLRRILAQGFDRTNIVGTSLTIQKVLEKVQLIAPLDTTILITGETGVGKELFAELVYKNSKRKDKRFVAVNCGGLPEGLLESMLFGHKKGAFTDAIRDKIGYFQEAAGGTLFLDEITETSQAFQIKLLRALEKGVIRRVGGDEDIEVDVRIIAATNKNIEEEVKNGNFREDLYYRLNVINIHIPPLRERVEDIKLLANVFVKEFAEKYDKKGLTISEPVMSILTTREWKGNIRELKNSIEHAVALATHNKIIPADLPAYIYQSGKTLVTPLSLNLISLPFAKAKEKFEKNYVEELINNCNGDVTKAAEISNIKRQNLYDKFKRYNIDINKYRKNNENS